MRILLTGATGFIGSNLRRKLIRENRKIVVFRGDVRNKKDVKMAVEGIDIVINLAALLPHDHATKEEYQETNTGGVKNFIEALKGKRIKHFIHISTVGIYDRPPSYYSLSKKKAEDILHNAYLEDRFPVTIVRPTIAYGPGDTRPVFLKLFKMVDWGLSIYVGSGNNFLHTIYVDNLTDAIVKIIGNMKAVGEDFVVGDEPCVTMKEIIRTIEKVVNKKTLIFHIPLFLARIAGRVTGMSQRVRFLSEDRKYDIAKTKKALGWSPKVGLEHGLRATYSWYLKEGMVGK